MPHVSEVRATSHDRHDPMLVAALAAGDLAGTDRDQAITMIGSCADCATLHADLIAIAHATATLPAPVTTAPRDFRLSPQQAERLRPGGWRRYVPSMRASFTRPLGVTLATFGLVGLLIGNVPIGLGGSAASAPERTSGGAGSAAGAAVAPETSGLKGEVTAAGTVASAAAASSGAAMPAASAAASGAPADVNLGPAAASGISDGGGFSVASGEIGVAGGITPGVTTPNGQARDTTAEVQTPAPASPIAVLNIASVAAVIAGLALLIASRRRGRSTA